MKYTEVNLTLSPFSQQDAEILIALLAEIGFDSFIESPEGVIAYIPSNEFQSINIQSFINNLPIQPRVTYTSSNLEDKNWNKQWESNFQPISVEKFCRVRAPFHKPEGGYKLEIIIEPKMAFGTGHHQTTWLMLRELFNLNLKAKKVLDMGCGTGILAIVAEKLGASVVTAVDNDSWAFENAKENLTNNNCNRTTVLLGDSNILGEETYDIILANINLNILLNDLKKYVDSLNQSGLLIMSGILSADTAILAQTAEINGLNVIGKNSMNDWMLLTTQKI